MIVLPHMAMKLLMQQIVDVTHNLSDETGETHVSATIGEQQLRMAAITAVQIATGEAVWPGDRKITLKRVPRSYGIFSEE